MKIYSQGIFLSLNLLLIPYCLGMDTFENQLNELLSGKLKYSVQEYKVFTTTYEVPIIKYIQNDIIKLDQPIVTEHPHNASHVQYFIHFIAITGNQKILKTIIEKNPSMLEQRNSSGETPLMLACSHTNVACTEYLLTQDADPMNMFLDTKQYWYSTHPMFHIIHITDSENQSVEDIKKILSLILKKYPQFLTYEYKGQVCLSCVEELMLVKNWTSYPNDDPEEIRVKKEKLEYLNQIKKFVEAKMKLRRFAIKEDSALRYHQKNVATRSKSNKK